MDSLEPLSDDQQIENLLAELATTRDRGDWEAAARLLARATFQTFYPARYPGNRDPTEDTTDRSPGTHGLQRGFEETREIFARTTHTYEDGLPFTLYLVTNIIIEVADDRESAVARSYYVVMQSRPDFALQPVSAGRYRDTFARDDAGWYFTERVIYADHSGDLRHHLAMDPLAYSRPLTEPGHER